MPWPGLNDLQEALQHPEQAFTDRELRDGEIALNPLGLPRSWSGNFAAVFQVVVNGNPYAVRCFTRNPLGKQNRYEAIDHHLKTNGKPATFVDFEYQETGLICRGQEYPLIRMPFIHGKTLDKFTYENIGKPDVLEQLASEWYQAATELQRLPIAHNDLQHGNVMVEQGNSTNIKLVDYDGLYVPQFANQDSPENGHRHYQHPGRDQRHYGPEVDNFPALVIYTSLIALARDPGAKARRATAESLLFAQADLQEPQNSPLFKYLEQSSDQQTAQLARALSDAAKGRVADTPTLEQVSRQKSKAALPSWLTQPTQPNTAPWTAGGTTAPSVAPSQPATQPPAGTPSASQDPAQHNRNLVDEELQGIGREIKPAVIRYAKQMQQSGWTFQSVQGVTGIHIRSIKDLENSGPDATALGAVLRAILADRRDDPLSHIGMSNTHIGKMRKIRHDHAHSLVDFSNQDYVDDALKTLRNFRRSVQQLPKQLPKINNSSPVPTRPPTQQIPSPPSARNPSRKRPTPSRQTTSPRNQPRPAHSRLQSTRKKQDRNRRKTDNMPEWEILLNKIFDFVGEHPTATIITIAIPALVYYLPRFTNADKWGWILGAWTVVIMFTLMPIFAKTCDIVDDLWWQINRIRSLKRRILVRVTIIATTTLFSLFLVGFLLTPPRYFEPQDLTATILSTPTPTAPSSPEQKRTADQEQIQRSKNRSALINQYAHCNGAYSDQEAGERAQAIAQFIQTSATTSDEIRQIVHEECPPIPVNNDAAKLSTPHLTTTSALSPQTIPTTPSSPDQPSMPNPTAIPDVAIPTVAPAPSPTHSPYHLSTSLKPSDVQQLYDADGGLLSSQNYEIGACYYDPHNTGTPPKWKLFTQPGQSLLEPVFAIHFNEPINLQHGLCYDFNVSFLGPTEWRACTSQPYGGNCDHNSSDFLWEREIPAFRGNPDSATYIWTPDPDNR